MTVGISVPQRLQCPTFSGGSRAIRAPLVANPHDGDTSPMASKQAAGVGMSTRAISFGPFRLFPEERLLLEGDTPVRIGSRALDILITMVERPSRVVSHEELMAKVWPNLFVEPANLTVHIAKLRRLLGDGCDGNRYLINIPGRGYRFVAMISDKGEPPAAAQSDVAHYASNLPAQLAKLVGRRETLGRLASQLAEERLLTIVGPGGIGKSSVALAAAEQARGHHEHGAWQIDLARLSEASLIPSAIASALGLGERGGSTIASLVEALRDKTMLLVFDNCEHVVEAAASAVKAILRGAPGARILATGREPLCAEGEHRYRLPPLGVPSGSRVFTAAEALRFSAVELFVQCVAAKLESFALTDADAPLIVDLCRKLDGIPLAIEFAANLIDTLGVRGLERRLQSGVQALTGGYRTAFPRHQTMRSMLDWSYDWLPELERIILRRLSILGDDFTFEHAVAITADDDIDAASVGDGLASLVTKSLVAADIAGKEPMYRLLETTRAYALEKLRESGELDLLVRAKRNKIADPLDRAEAE